VHVVGAEARLMEDTRKQKMPSLHQRLRCAQPLSSMPRLGSSAASRIAFVAPGATGERVALIRRLPARRPAAGSQGVDHLRCRSSGNGHGAVGSRNR